MVYSTRRFVLSLALCYFVFVFFSPFNIAITSLGEERANLSAFHTLVRFALVCFVCFLFLFVSGKELRLVILALPELFSYLLCSKMELFKFKDKYVFVSAIQKKIVDLDLRQCLICQFLSSMFKITDC